ncbi:septal ring lytic transglycosylase RlpA family protein [Photobacterium lipolyticum]|uniref:Endolytic peptidoglycan transglycosylase RlpA n=1 Tax=Photobacterium lipolyticum TaxID=266810 RepID=A0A2T3MVS6_9GAMM|nr:septal ring lytic transglycosylase RlpA family protein [Photobacterium lipolyticum]PSW04009.1 septal ring lytic transglycosylase RlpA [Photobacterium lipolyticum]
MRALSILFLLLLTGCSSTPSKERYDITDDVAPENSPTLDHIEDAQPRYEPISLAGNKNYTLRGQDYTIVTDQEGFTQEGHASWYGKKFHGHKTSNGEIYDMYSMTAAHKTLPLPSYVKVTNQKNGKTAIVRINDRGPFHDGRIIDLSMAAASKLDLIKDGTAPVKIELIQVAKPVSPDEWQTANPNYYYVQLAAVSDENKARLVADKLAETFATSVDLKKSESAAVYRVRLGPYLDRDEAIGQRDKAKANNYPKAFIITTQREFEQK